MITLTVASAGRLADTLCGRGFCPLLVLQPQFLGSGCLRSVRPIRRPIDLSASRQQLTELLDCRQLAGTDLIVLAVRGFGDPLSDGDEPFIHLGALIRRQ